VKVDKKDVTGEGERVCVIRWLDYSEVWCSMYGMVWHGVVVDVVVR
jgi:hypothetical protein